MSTLENGSWKLDLSDAEIGFTTRTMWGVVPVRGSFSEYHGTFDASASPAIELVISAATVDTNNAKRDEHLRSADFFDVADHPEIRFTASGVEVHGDHLHIADGVLSAAGRTLAIEPATHVHEIDGGYEIDAVARINIRALGMSGGPGGMISSKSWLNVRARLIPA